ncbi:hypothetical protein ACO0LD_31515 [Undibacterium sp. Ji83W]|uniref:hypothetical protein n=1 Tax=Undibacterium sp. Ji83W TaxID=3413043 RepID=UPI003BF20758
MEFDPFAPKPQGRSGPSTSSPASALSLVDSDKPAAKKTEPVAPPSSQRELTGHDIANLNPKEFRNANLGLEFYAPGSWREVKNSRSLHLLDPVTDTRLEANGFAREDISIEKWVGMRLHIIDKEMPHMKQVAKPTVFKGENWGNRIQGIVAEYKGKQAGDEEESHMLICCLRTDSMLVSIAVTAKASVFDINRAVYNWIFSRSDISMAMAAVSGGAKNNTGASVSTSARARTGGAGGNGGSHSSASSEQSGHHHYQSAGEHDVGRLASGQRLLILGIVFYFVLVGWTKSIDFGNRVEVLSFCCLGLMIIFMSIFGFFRLAGGFGWSGAKTLLMFVLSFVPLVNLILMVVYNIKATARIKEDGYKVGLLGARAAIPDDNHDLRNIFLVSLALTACLYVLSVKAFKAQKEDPIAEFSPPDHRYSISMPGTPVEQASPKADGVFNNHTYSLRAGKMHYAITSFDLAVRPADTTYFLDTLRDGIASQGKIKVTDEKTIRVEGNVGRSLMLSAKDAMKKVDFFLVGKTVYIIEAGAPGSEANSPKIAAFFDSFHLN